MNFNVIPNIYLKLDLQLFKWYYICILLYFIIIDEVSYILSTVNHRITWKLGLVSSLSIGGNRFQEVIWHNFIIVYNRNQMQFQYIYIIVYVTLYALIKSMFYSIWIQFSLITKIIFRYLFKWQNINSMIKWHYMSTMFFIANYERKLNIPLVITVKIIIRLFCLYQ